MHKRQAKEQGLPGESPNRTGEKAWLQLSWKEYALLAAENNGKDHNCRLVR
jgi:hypothetical protein